MAAIRLKHAHLLSDNVNVVYHPSGNLSKHLKGGKNSKLQSGFDKQVAANRPSEPA